MPAHQYLGVDLQLVWRIVERDLPPLKEAVDTLLDDTENRLQGQTHPPSSTNLPTRYPLPATRYPLPATRYPPMRLSPAQANAIKDTVARLGGPGSRVWLFGSRVDDSLRGGDIDLLVETEAVIPNRIKTLCRIEGALVMALGDRKLDVLLKDGRTPEVPVFGVARRRGVLL